MSIRLAYRPDIDGLRALAVLAVIAYHYFPTAVPNGYLGVDLFFVISGYLITRIILSGLAEGKFSFQDFYMARLLRLIPALYVCLLIVGLIAYQVQLPTPFREFGQSLLAATLYASNVLFYLKSNYFSAASDTKPLLHTWSLGVEEQFYLLFPMLLAVCFWWGRRWVGPVVLGLLLVSLAGFLWLGGATDRTAFFLLPFRAWELFAGALIAVASGWRLSERWSHWCLGLALLAIATVLFGGEAVALGIWLPAVVCLAGMSLIAVGGVSSRGAPFLLQLSPLRFVGKISYSLYLWHWPLLVLLKAKIGAEPGPWQKACLGIVTVLVATASWRWVEQPFRRMPRDFWKIAPIYAASSVSLAGVGLLIFLQAGLPQRWPEDVQKIDAAARDYNPERRQCGYFTALQVEKGEDCRLGSPEAPLRFLVWGDSHASAIQPGLQAAAMEASVGGRFLAKVGCPLSVGITGGGGECGAFNRSVIAQIAKTGVLEVWLISRWGETALAQTQALLVHLQEHSELSEVRFRIVAEVASPSFDVPIELGRLAASGRLVPDSFELRARTKTINNAMIAFIEEQLGQRFVFLDINAELCSDGWCRLLAKGRPLFYDSHHLSSTGAKFLAPAFVSAINEDVASKGWRKSGMTSLGLRG